MLYAIVCIAQALCVLLTLAPLRAGAACTPATHRARQAFGALCAALALVSFGRFVWFVVLNGHGIGPNVVIGQLVGVSFAAQAFVLLRGLFPRPPVAVGLALLSGALALAAALKTVLTFTA